MNFDDFAKDFPKILEKAIDDVTDKRELDKIGSELVKDIKKRTKLGIGVDKPRGNSKKFKKLETSTKKSRGYTKKNSNLSSDTTPAKSNLTRTGAMVDSLHHNAKDGAIVIDVDSDEVEKVEFNADNGREFMNLSKAQVNKLEKDLEKDLVAEIKKALK